MIKKLLKEFLGTFVLVLMGTTVISLTGGNMFATALAFGFLLLLPYLVVLLPGWLANI